MTDPDRVPTTVTHWWDGLESGWRAVVLAALVVLAVLLGVPIPW